MKEEIKPRLNLELMPARIAALPIAKNGYPVPWFVAWENGVPEFRAADGRKFVQAIKFGLCWVCGQKLGVHKTFVIGPMCGINRTTAEPPCHDDCAHWSAVNCPFLSNPEMIRREKGLMGECPAGHMIKRNPGVTLLWTTRSFRLFRDGLSGTLINIGTPERTFWYRRGKLATRTEVMDAIASGFPILHEMARRESPAAIGALEEARLELENYLPIGV